MSDSHHDLKTWRLAEEVISVAGRDYQEIKLHTAFNNLEENGSRLLAELRNEPFLTAWVWATVLPLSPPVLHTAELIARHSPGTFAALLEACDPAVGRSLVASPKTNDDFGALARCLQAARAPWVATMLLSVYIEALRHLHGFVNLGAPVAVNLTQATDLLAAALQRVSFDVGLALGLATLRRPRERYLIEQACGDGFEQILLQLCRLVARHPDGPERLCDNASGGQLSEPDHALVVVGEYCRIPSSGAHLRQVFLQQLSQLFDNDARHRIIPNEMTIDAKIFVWAMANVIRKDLAGTGDWWNNRWACHSRTLTSWPRDRHLLDYDRLVTLAAIAIDVCASSAMHDHTALATLGRVLDQVGPLLPDLVLCVNPRESATFVCVELLFRGLSNASQTELLAERAEAVLAKAARSLRTSRLVEAALLGSKAASGDAVQPSLENLRAKLIEHEQSLGE